MLVVRFRVLEEMSCWRGEAVLLKHGLYVVSVGVLIEAVAAMEEAQETV